jgi:hypothetical protein
VQVGLERDEYQARAVRPVGERERREYDAFGPWMQAVAAAGELPPLFDPYWNELSRARIIAKVPYHVERRDALPGSDLYVQVFALGERGFIFLRIDGGSISRQELPFERLSWLALVVGLLDARLVFGDAGGDRRELPFNAVSEPLAREIIDAARERLRASADPAREFRARGSGDLVSPPTFEADFHFANVMRILLAHEGEASLMAYQPPYRVPAGAERRRSLFGIVREAFRPTFLDSSMLLELPAELILVREGKGPRRGRKGFCVETVWMPLSSLLAPAIEERQLPNGGIVSVLHVEARGGGREMALASLPEAALSRLEELVPRADGARSRPLAD